MPSVSNWWGVFVLPLLGWLASRAVTGRVSAGEGTVTGAVGAFAGAVAGEWWRDRRLEPSLRIGFHATVGKLLAALVKGLLAATGAIVVAMLGLLGYVPGLRALGSVREDYIPMAPSTAVNIPIQPRT